MPSFSRVLARLSHSSARPCQKAGFAFFKIVKNNLCLRYFALDARPKLGHKARMKTHTFLKLCLIASCILLATPAAEADPPKSPEAKAARWIYEASLTWVPLAAVTNWESKEEADVRRLAIATDVAAVAFDAQEKPVFDSGSDFLSRANTALFLASIASYESGYDIRVDRGHCEALPGGLAAKWCDGGNAHTMWQHNIGKGKTIDGWTKDDLIADRKKAVRAALHALQLSAKTCAKSYAGADAFSVYAQGFCGPSPKMRERLGRATSYASTTPFKS